MERLVAVLATELSREGEGGEEVRQFAELLGIVETICPWVTPIRLGLCTFPVRGPSRLLGGDSAVLAAVRMDLERAGFVVRLGIAPGLFAATVAAERGAIVGEGELEAFLAPLDVSVLERPDLTRLLPRLGVRTLGAFADLGAREVYARFGPDALSCHRVASGEEGELRVVETQASSAASESLGVGRTQRQCSRASMAGRIDSSSEQRWWRRASSNASVQRPSPWRDRVVVVARVIKGPSFPSGG